MDTNCKVKYNHATIHRLTEAREQVWLKGRRDTWICLAGGSRRDLLGGLGVGIDGNCETTLGVGREESTERDD